MSTENKSEYLVEVKHLKQYFPVRTGFMKTIPLKAVDDVSFSIRPGETLGLVGESGCGKTTVGRTLMHLYKPTAGEIYFEGKQVTEKNIGEFRKDMQMVFQDPYSSLDPRMTVEDIIGEPLDVHKLYSTKEERRQSKETEGSRCGNKRSCCSSRRRNSKCCSGIRQHLTDFR